MLERILYVPMKLNHHVTRCRMFRKVEKPERAPGVTRANEKWRVVDCPRRGARMVAQRPLYEGSPAIPISVLDQVVYLRFGQLQRRDRLHDLRRFRQMVDERVRGKSQNDLGGWQFIEDTGDKRQFDLRESGLIQKEDCPSGAGLSSTDRTENTLDFVFKKSRFGL